MTAETNRASAAGALGLLSGLAAATVGTVPIAGGVRLWHVLALVAAMIAVLSDNGRSVGGLRLRSIDVLAVSFIAVTVVTELANGADLNFKADVVGTLTPIFYFILFWSARAVVRNIAGLEKFIYYFVLPSAPVALIGMGQMLAPGAFSWVTSLAPSSALEGRLDAGDAIRATGLVGDWTGNGFYFCVVLAALASLVLIRRESGRRVGSLAVLFVFAGGGVIASVTLGALITAVVIVLALLLASRVSPRLVLVFGFAAALLTTVFGDLIWGRIADQATAGVRVEGMPTWLPNTVAFRWAIWTRETIPAIGQRLWTGWGTDAFGGMETGRTYPQGLIWKSPESQWFAEALYFGVPTAILLAALFVFAIRSALRAAAGLGRIAWPVAALICVTVVMSLISPVLTNRGFPVALWPLLGAVLSVLESRLKTAELDLASHD